MHATIPRYFFLILNFECFLFYYNSFARILQLHIYPSVPETSFLRKILELL